MDKLINVYINKINKEDINKFALKNNIILDSNELEFILFFIKKDGFYYIKNKDKFNLSLYKDYFSNENYNKLSTLLNEYLNKYSSLLK